MLPLIQGLISLAPSIIGLFKGDEAEEKAEAEADIARTVTGVNDNDDEVLSKLKSSPELLNKFMDKTLALQTAEIENETKRLETINKTIRTEYETKDNFRGRWRPYWGYVSGTAFGLQIFFNLILMQLAIVWHPMEAADMIKAIAELNSALTVTWGIALTVLGVAVHKRSKDKEVASGVVDKEGIFKNLVGKIFNK